MKTILVLVDFSNASDNALSFAAALSNKSSARLVIAHILQNKDDENEAKNKLVAVEAALKNRFASGLNHQSLVAHGNLIATVKKIISVQQPDLIVMGTKGASGLKKIMIGSNTVNVIANTTLPVLVIPEVSRFDHFMSEEKNRIVLATDLEIVENSQALKVLKTMALLMVEPRITVLNVRRRNTMLADEKRMERHYLVTYFNPEIETDTATVFSGNVIDGIDFYLQNVQDTGLITMIARDSGHLIQKHYTHDMASQTHLPLLVLHDAED